MTTHMSKQQWIVENLKPGDEYAGLILGKDGARDHHLILLPGQANDVKWAAAMAWAKTVGGELPTRREQSLLFANLKDQFEQRWYWSSETHSSDPVCVWVQYFGDGDQSYGHEYREFRACAVRRIPV